MARFTTNHAMAGRGLAILAVIICLLLPGLDIGRGQPQLTVLIDQSDGMADAALARATQQLAADIEASNGQLKINMSAYGIAGLAPTAAEALKATLWSLDPALRNGIVIVSDGHWRPEMRAHLEQAARADLPVFWLPANPAEEAARIISIVTADRARAGQNVLVHIGAIAPQSGNYEVLLSANDKIIGQLPLVRNEYTTFRVPVAGRRTMLFDAELLDTDSGMSLDQRHARALLNIVSPPKILVIAGGTSPLGESLSSGGWSVLQISPREFAGRSSPLSDYSALILDDVAATDLPESAWTNLVDAVRNDALGMIVLGGPNSFGLGAYRESILESVLPVISEPPEDEQPASVIFLVDISGSMGRQPEGTANLNVAQDAVLFSASALRSTDRVGLIAFDVEARQLLAPSSRDDHAAAIRNVWPANASGGTSIIPALDLARSTMMLEDTDQGLLMLVTDGKLAADDLEELESWLQESDFELVVMNLSGELAGTPLSRSTLSEYATILKIDDVLQLPVLMRNEIESRRPAMIVERTVPIVGSGPLLPNRPLVWPPIDAYLVTRAKTRSTVMLEASRRVPLLSSWTAGAGRVVALTAGLNQWAADWLAWSNWPEAAAGLVNHVMVTDSTTVLPVIESESSGRVAIHVDTSATDLPVAMDAWLVPADGPATAITFIPDAPGRHRAFVDSISVGRYTLVWEDDASLNRHSFLTLPRSGSARGGEPAASRYASEGLLAQWDARTPNKLAPRTIVKSLLVALALSLFIATIAAERIPRIAAIRRILERNRIVTINK